MQALKSAYVAIVQVSRCDGYIYMYIHIYTLIVGCHDNAENIKE